MFQTVLFFLHYIVLLLFGLLLSLAFSGVDLRSRKGTVATAVLLVLSGGLQLSAYLLFDESLVWEIYPVITHAPIILCIVFLFRRSLSTAIASVATAYLCCQPAKWMGLLAMSLTQNATVEYVVRIVTLLAVGYISLSFIAPNLAKLFTKDFRSVCIFGSIPVVYYLFDYLTGVYAYLWNSNRQLIAEFVPFVLCIFFVVFCTMYYREYEKKSDAERRERLIQISVQQQQSQIETIKRTEKELRILRHDMRLFLSSLFVCIENNEQENAKEMIQSHISRVEATKLERFCENDFVNYVLSDFASQCAAAGIPFACNVEIGDFQVDEMLFCSILSNALDNAIHAQQSLPPEKKSIKLMLKNADGRLLLSVKNAIRTPPVFVDGLPVTNRKGHGFGTQSIRYVTEALGGNCQFSVQDNCFVLRVVL